MVGSNIAEEKYVDGCCAWELGCYVRMSQGNLPW